MSSIQRTMSYKVWNETITNILDSNEFKVQMQNRGYFLSPGLRTFREYTNKIWGIISTMNSANFLSKDFWHQQSVILRNKNYYLIRTGEGSFAIFDEHRFLRPYLNLDIVNDFTELSEDAPQGFDHLKSAFRENILENTGLEQLRFNGVYDKMIEAVTGTRHQFYVGVRGNTTRSFDVYFKRADSKIEKIRTYTGQAELDYTLWTSDSVFLFEAKKAGREGVKRYFDIGWHKFAYAAIRFINYGGLKIYPVYFLRSPKQIFLFVFPQFKFHENGIILNGKSQMTPSNAFVVNHDVLIPIIIKSSLIGIKSKY
jgi:hypothetical protein